MQMSLRKDPGTIWRMLNSRGRHKELWLTCLFP